MLRFHCILTATVLLDNCTPQTMRLALLLADALTVKSLADENLCLLTPGGPLLPDSL
jgi:hypothetical protein